MCLRDEELQSAWLYCLEVLRNGQYMKCLKFRPNTTGVRVAGIRGQQLC
jgi:hypothetical protein